MRKSRENIMRIFDIITKKKHGGILTDEEISYMINAFVKGDIADYQMAAMLMAVWFQGMNDHELSVLTQVMAKSGDSVDLSAIEGEKADKHSTGGVGDKTTLIVAPLVAACGGKVAKMSGRGLGHTGGTIDKLESIPGLRTSLTRTEFFSIVNKIGLSVISQTGNIAPADKKIYALRDVTATIDSIPLIASSIMSKKLAAGSDCIVLDVKTGSGAFMKTLDESIELAQKMVSIGERAGRKTVALITDMDIPLGAAIGNSLEVIESVETLRGSGPDDLTEICLQLAANMLHLLDKGSVPECRAMAKNAINNGSALEKFAAMVQAQGGDASFIYDTHKFAAAHYSRKILAAADGFISKMNAEKCGIAAAILGAGREIKGAEIDSSAGIMIRKKYGEAVRKGDILAELFTSEEKRLEEAEHIYKDAVAINEKEPEKIPLVFARIESEKIERY